MTGSGSSQNMPSAAWVERDCPNGLTWEQCRDDDCGPRTPDGRGCLTLPDQHQERTR
jgi:hypothetical protein